MILDRIVAERRRAVAERARLLPERRVRRLAEVVKRRPLDMAAALRGNGVSVIAEVKRRSPSAGDIRAGLDAGETARGYAAAGAAAVSVLTEPTFFGGSHDDLAAARAALSGDLERPVLLKDFVISPYQLYEARAVGADAVLLIAACLADDDLDDLAALAGELGMAALIEVHDREELERVLPAGPALVGINNRDLRTFSVSIETTLALAPLVPPATTVVSESGIRGADDVRRLAEAGVHAVLVGEAILRSPDPMAMVRELARATA